MDMEVDTAYLSAIQSKLNSCKENMSDSANLLSSAVRVAGNDLEGRQYSLSVEATDSSCNIIRTSANNIKKLEEFLSHLEEYVNEYIRCKYEV